MNDIIDNKRKSEVLADAISALDYGDVIYHKAIAEAIQEEYGCNKYTSTVQQAKKILLKEYGKALESVRGDGYRVIKPDDFVTHSLRHYKRGFNEFQKGSDILTYAPVKDMSDEGRETYRHVNDRAVLLYASLKGGIVELKTLGEKRHPLLPENINT